MPLVLRSAKGSQLTTAEMDGNLSYLESLNAALPPVTISGTSATLDAATHANRLLICTNAAPVTLTLTTDGAGGWANDDSINAIQYGAGSVTIVAGGAALRAPTGSLATTAAQYRLVGATRIGASEWTLTEVSGGSGGTTTIENMAISGFSSMTPVGNNFTDITYTGIRSTNTGMVDSSTLVGFDDGVYRGVGLQAAASAVNRTAGIYNNALFLSPNVGAPTYGKYPVAIVAGIGDANPTLGSMFIGVRNNGNAADSFNTANLLNSVNMLGCGFDAADANWQVVHNDGSGTTTKIDMGAPFVKTQGVPISVLITKNAGGTSYVVKATNLSTGAVFTSPAITTNYPASWHNPQVIRGSVASAIQVNAFFGGFYCGVPG